MLNINTNILSLTTQTNLSETAKRTVASNQPPVVGQAHQHRC